MQGLSTVQPSKIYDSSAVVDVSYDYINLKTLLLNKFQRVKQIRYPNLMCGHLNSIFALPYTKRLQLLQLT